MKQAEPEIDQVIFVYTGTDDEFNCFLKSIIHDYITDNLDDEFQNN